MDEELRQNAIKLIKGEGEEKGLEGRCEIKETEKTDVELLDA